MEEDLTKRCVSSPKLLDLIPKESDWMVRDSAVKTGFGVVQEEKKLELKLGLPGNEDWEKFDQRKSDDPSVLSLGYVNPKPKPSKTSKRGFLDTLKSKNEGFERKTCAPSSVNAAETNNTNNSETNRTTSSPVVGWPPIRSFRKNLASSSSKPPLVVSQNGGSETGKGTETSKKGLFVKINMDGIPIGRKVDLKAYDSYEKLSSAVEKLFSGLFEAQKDPATPQVSEEGKQTFTGLLDGSGEYTLVYEDNEGDRMLAGDVPWEMFVSTVKRLRVLKSSELSTLTLGAVSRKRTATGC